MNETPMERDNPQSRIRASDTDRERVAKLLEQAAAEGRLTLSEYGDRSASAYAAVTTGDLNELLHDLPVSRIGETTPAASASVATQAYHPHLAAPPERHFKTILNDLKHHVTGPAPKTIRVTTVLGDVTLDLRDAALTEPELTIDGVTFLGDVKIIVPNGIEVIDEGTKVLADSRSRTGVITPGAPKIRVRITSILGDLKIIDADNAKKKRSWWGSKKHD